MKKSLGQIGEDIAARYLLKNGYKLLDRNYRIRGGEIDIIAVRDNKLVVVEVKTRWDSSYGNPEEAVSYYKLRFLQRTLDFYLVSHQNMPEEHQIDVISVLFHRPKGYSIHHFESITS